MDAPSRMTLMLPWPGLRPVSVIVLPDCLIETRPSGSDRT